MAYERYIYSNSIRTGRIIGGTFTAIADSHFYATITGASGKENVTLAAVENRRKFLDLSVRVPSLLNK